MDGYEICKEIRGCSEGLKRLLKLYDYLPKELYSKIYEIINLGIGLDRLIAQAEKEAQQLKEDGYKRGFEEGMRKGIDQLQSIIDALSKELEDKRREENKRLETLFRSLLKRLSREISEECSIFVEGYVKRFVNAIGSEKVKIIVSSSVYEQITSKLALPENVILVPDRDLDPEQVFVERDSSLIDCSIDRFFEEILD